MVSEPEDGGPDVDSAAWRWTLLVGAIPGLLVMYGAICLTETPQFMMGSTTKGEDGKALAYLLLGELRQSEDVSREYARMALYCDRRSGPPPPPYYSALFFARREDLCSLGFPVSVPEFPHDTLWRSSGFIIA